MRLFFGLHLSAASRWQIAERLNRLRSSVPEVNWVLPQNLHLTMAFLGELDCALVPQLQAAATRACHGATPIVLQFDQQLGAFASWQRPQVIWLGVDKEAEQLHRLHAGLSRELSKLGFAADRRWHPHVTLGRVKRRLSAVAESELQQSAWSLPQEQLSELTLFQSTLRPAGPVYQPVFKSLFRDCEKE